MSSFEDIANTSLDEIKDLPPIPVGTYLVVIVGPHEMITSAQKQTPGCQFNLRLTQARDDVDQFSLQEALGGRNLQDVTMRYVIWDSQYAGSALRNFLRDSLGIAGSASVKQALAEVPGKNCLISVIHRPFTDNSGNARLRAEISGTAAA